MNKVCKKYISGIWEKAQEVPGYPKNSIRKDACGAWIVFNDYNNPASPFGWGIDHIFPLALCSVHQISVADNKVNLRPLHLKNLKKKGSSFPFYYSAVKAQDDRNVDEDGSYKVSMAVQEELRSIGLYK